MNVITEIVQSRELLTNLTLRELRGKYKRSLLGWTWSLLNPQIRAQHVAALRQLAALANAPALPRP